MIAVVQPIHLPSGSVCYQCGRAISRTGKHVSRRNSNCKTRRYCLDCATLLNLI